MLAGKVPIEANALCFSCNTLAHQLEYIQVSKMDLALQ